VRTKSSKIIDMSRDTCLAMMDQLIEVAKDYSDWGPDQFLSELPDKYALSFIVLDDGIAGYSVMSRKWPGRVHIHHFMIDLKKRNVGFGQIMLCEAAQRAGNVPLSLKVSPFNVGAIRFYERHGFAIEKREGDSYWMLKPAEHASLANDT
jgi:ribosomal protein S18 acetylase RimI-like enzyme